MTSMSDAQRETLKSAYLTPNWAEKVDKMSSAQVAAILQRLQSQGKVK